MIFIEKFLSHLIFGKMLFATAEVVPSIGDAGGSSGSTGDSGGNDAGVANDGGSGDSAVVDGANDGVGAPDESGQQLNPADSNPEVAGDGRTIPTKWRELFKQDKELRNLYFGYNKFKQEFPGGIPEAAKFREFYNTVGGEEGIQAYEAEKAEWDALDQQYSAADPKFVENISAENPEAFSKLAPHVIEQFAKLDRDGYNHTMSRLIVNTLQGWRLNEVYNALAANEQTKHLAEHLANAYNGLDELARNVPQKKVDPEREKFEKEKQEFEQNKVKAFRESVSTEMSKFNVSQIETHLSSEMKARGLDLAKVKSSDPEDYRILLSNCNQSLSQALAKDAQFLKKFEQFMASGDKNGAVKFAQSRISAVVADAVKKTYRAFTKVGGGQAAEIAKREATNAARKDIGPGAPGGGNKLPKPPDGSQIDWSRTNTDMVWKGEAFLKGQKDKVYF